MYKNRAKKYTYFMKLPLFYFFSMLKEIQKACSDNSVLTFSGQDYIESVY